MSPAAQKVKPGEGKISLKLTGPHTKEESTARITYDYHCRSVGTLDRQSPAWRILEAMKKAAEETDREIWMEQNPDTVRTGRLRLGNWILTKWIEVDDDNVIPVDKREATSEERVEIPEWGEGGWEGFVD